MKSMRQIIMVVAVAMAIGMFAAPGRAMASDRWNFGFQHFDDHSRCDKAPVSNRDKDCDRDHDRDCHESKSVPEIDPNGLAGMGSILAGGIALITARRRRIIK